MEQVESLTASLEDYLEAIFQIIAEKQGVRPKDIARRLKVSNASVTGALRALTDKALIHYIPHDVITLTEEGKTAARDVIRRHEVLRDFFVKVLAVAEPEADQAACLMEHSIPKVILERFVQFAEFVEVCPRGGSNWIEGFKHHCDHEDSQANCEGCIARTLEGLKEQKLKVGRRAMTGVKLKELKPGERGRVLKINNRAGINQRIIEMGVTTGAVVELERAAPLGDPIDIKVKGYHLSLREKEAEGIEIEAL
jgi:DtxR family Mn-dependent transcriptional regulator